MPLLLKLRASPDGLPSLSQRVGDFVRTNSEVLMAVVSGQHNVDFSKGIAIGTILHTDEHSHLEPVRYPAGSGFFRLLAAPHAPGRIRWCVDCVRSGSACAIRCARFGRFRPRLGEAHDDPPLHADVRGLPPDAPRCGRTTYDVRLGRHRAARLGPGGHRARAPRGEKLDGYAESLVTEPLFGTPTTAHILGGGCMGATAEEGVIDARHRVFGYEGLYVIDGAAMSANPGVNPSLTITALAERAMSLVPPRDAGAPYGGGADISN